MVFRMVKPGGFCEGAARAVAMVKEASSEGARVRVWGELLHHPRVAERLKEKDVSVVASPDALQPGDCLVIRAHGAPKGVAETLAARGVVVHDATCRNVRRVQDLVAQCAARCDIVLVAGQAGHPETETFLTHAEGRGRIVGTAEEARRHASGGSVALVSQTTLPADVFEAIAGAVRDAKPRAEIHYTACAWTRAAQKAAAEAAGWADISVVAGGRNSANTQRLVDICGAKGKTVIRIETAEELKAAEFLGAARVAVVAGASTPPDVLAEIRAWFKEALQADEDEKE